MHWNFFFIFVIIIIIILLLLLKSLVDNNCAPKQFSLSLSSSFSFISTVLRSIRYLFTKNSRLYP